MMWEMNKSRDRILAATARGIRAGDVALPLHLTDRVTICNLPCEDVCCQPGEQAEGSRRRDGRCTLPLGHEKREGQPRLCSCRGYLRSAALRNGAPMMALQDADEAGGALTAAQRAALEEVVRSGEAAAQVLGRAPPR